MYVYLFMNEALQKKNPGFTILKWKKKKEKDITFLQ